MAPPGKKAAKRPVKQPVKQEDLRRLMREKQREKQRSATVTKRIDSPLARYLRIATRGRRGLSGGAGLYAGPITYITYNSLGHLYCVVCNIPIKSELLWQAHILGKLHKENVAEAKKTSTTPTVAPLPQKRKQSNVTDNVGQTSSQAAGGKSTAAPPPSKKSVLIGGYDDDEDDDEDDDDDDDDAAVKEEFKSEGVGNTNPASTPASDLPGGFFQSAAAPPPPVSHSGTITKAGETEVKPEKPKENTVEALPEGFFDDPVMDAKVRKVNLPKEQMEKEWEEFQKEMRQQTMVSEAMQAEDDEEVRVERQIKEIDEQIECYRRVEMLLDKRHSLKEKLKDTLDNQDKEDEEGDDQEELQNFLSGDWRAKGTWL